MIQVMWNLTLGPVRISKRGGMATMAHFSMKIMTIQPPLALTFGTLGILATLQSHLTGVSKIGLFPITLSMDSIF